MRIVRVRHNSKAFYASIGDDGYFTSLQHGAGSAVLSPDEVSLLPLVAPSKIICVGLNFRDHAKELNMPLPTEPAFFLKPPSSLLSNGQNILIPRGVGQVDYEAELAVVIGQHCRNVTPTQAADFVFGYTCANDVTARDLQKGEQMFGRCKGFDTFCPLGPWIETDMPPKNAGIRTLINGQVRQQGKISDMIASPLELVSAISRVMTLTPGDVILTGTPRGVGPICPGDTVRIEIDKVGELMSGVEWDDPALKADRESGFSNSGMYRLQ